MPLKDLIKMEVPDVSENEMIEAFEPTIEKLNRICCREGTANRLQLSYFAMLMSDVIKEKRASNYFKAQLNQTRCSERTDTPHITAIISLCV